MQSIIVESMKSSMNLLGCLLVRAQRALEAMVVGGVVASLDNLLSSVTSSAVLHHLYSSSPSHLRTTTLLHTLNAIHPL